jgi:hypothetical protein
MFILSLDVIPNLLNLRLTDRKDAVTFLPRKRAQRGKHLVYPSRRVCLQVTHQRGEGFVGSPTEQDVHMVTNPANLQNFSTFAANDATEIVVDARSNVRGKPRLTVFRAENEMEFQIVKRAGHERSLVRRPAGAEEVCLNYPRSLRVSLRSTRSYQPVLRWSTKSICNYE